MAGVALPPPRGLSPAPPTISSGLGCLHPGGQPGPGGRGRGGGGALRQPRQLRALGMAWRSPESGGGGGGGSLSLGPEGQTALTSLTAPAPLPGGSCGPALALYLPLWAAASPYHASAQCGGNGSALEPCGSHIASWGKVIAVPALGTGPAPQPVPLGLPRRHPLCAPTLSLGEPAACCCTASGPPGVGTGGRALCPGWCPSHVRKP